MSPLAFALVGISMFAGMLVGHKRSPVPMMILGIVAAVFILIAVPDALGWIQSLTEKEVEIHSLSVRALPILLPGPIA